MGTVNDIGIFGFAPGGILQPKLKNRWRVTFANIGVGDSTALSVQAVTVTRPSISFQEVQLDRYNSRAWIAGKYTFEPITLVIEDDILGSASQVIQHQLQKQQQLIGAGAVYLPVGTEGRLYKFIMNIDQLDGNQQVIEKWTVEGAWFRQVQFGDLDYAASETVRITMTIQYDHARQDLGGYTGLGNALGVPG